MGSMGLTESTVLGSVRSLVFLLSLEMGSMVLGSVETLVLMGSLGSVGSVGTVESIDSTGGSVMSAIVKTSSAPGAWVSLKMNKTSIRTLSLVLIIKKSLALVVSLKILYIKVLICYRRFGVFWYPGFSLFLSA